jgi:hypothetical protein
MFRVGKPAQKRLLTGFGKKWPQGLHRSTEYPTISTSAEDFSFLPVAIAHMGTALNSPQTAANPSLCIYKWRRIRKVTSTFWQSDV